MFQFLSRKLGHIAPRFRKSRISGRTACGWASKPVIESLESRQMLSVSVSLILPSLAAGSVYSYQVSNSSGGVLGTESIVIVGQTTFNGISCIEQDVKNTAVNGDVFDDKSYHAVTSQGYVNYGSLDTVTNASGGTLSSSTTTYTPAEVSFPTSISVGTPYTTTTTENTSDVTADDPTPSTSTDTRTETLTLVNQSTTSITVPAGTYDCYQVTDTQVDTSDGSDSTPTTSTEYLSSHSAPVEITDDSGTTIELTNDPHPSSGGGGGGSGGGGGTSSGITPTIVSSTVPANVVGGAKLHATLKLSLADTVTDKGFTVKIYASTTTTLDTSTASLVTSIPRPTTTIKANVAFPQVVALPGLPASLPNGTYYLIAQTTDSAGNTLSTASSSTVTVAAPFSTLGEAVTTTLPVSLVSGTKAKGNVKVVITNTTGNVPSKGLAEISLSASTVAGQVGTFIAMMSKSVNIAVGKSATVSIPVKAIPALANNSYFIVAQVTDPLGNISIASTSTPLTIAAPYITLGTTIAPIGKVKSGATITVSNNGNIDDVTRFTATIGVSLDAAGLQQVGSPVTLVSPKMTVKVGKSAKFHLLPSKSFLAGLMAGVPYYLTVTYTDSTGNTSSAVSPNTFTI